MSDTYNRYYREHIENHIGSNRNHVLEENCPYCKRARRWLYYSNLRDRITNRRRLNNRNRINNRVPPATRPRINNNEPALITNLRQSRAVRAGPRVESRRMIRINNIIEDYNISRNRNTPLVSSFTPTPLLIRGRRIDNYDVLSRLQPVEIMTTLQEINENSTVNVMKSNDKTRCVICQLNIQKNEIIRKLQCRHYFHMVCIDKWLENHKVCPICKHSF